MSKLSDISILFWTNGCAADTISKQIYFRSHDFDKIFVAIPYKYSWDAGQVKNILTQVGFTEVNNTGERSKIVGIEGTHESKLEKFFGDVENFFHDHVKPTVKRRQFDFTVTLKGNSSVDVVNLENTKRKLVVTKGWLREFFKQ